MKLEASLYLVLQHVQRGMLGETEQCQINIYQNLKLNIYINNKGLMLQQAKGSFNWLVMWFGLNATFFSWK